FLSALSSNGNSNTLKVGDLTLTNGYLVVKASTAFSPRNPDKSAMSCFSASPFAYTVRFRLDLTEVVTASAVGCTGNSVQPPSDVSVSPTVGFVGNNTFYATIQPLTTQLPITVTWEINGLVQRTAVINDRRDTFSYTWPAPVSAQTLQVR